MQGALSCTLYCFMKSNSGHDCRYLCLYMCAHVYWAEKMPFSPCITVCAVRSGSSGSGGDFVWAPKLRGKRQFPSFTVSLRDTAQLQLNAVGTSFSIEKNKTQQKHSDNVKLCPSFPCPYPFPEVTFQKFSVHTQACVSPFSPSLSSFSQKANESTLSWFCALLPSHHASLST